MKIRLLFPGFLPKGEKIQRLKEKIDKARDRLAEAMLEECELRGRIQEVLDAVFARMGKLEKKAELLRNHAGWLRESLCTEKPNAEGHQKFWKAKQEKIEREYENVQERVEERREREKSEELNFEKKKPRLRKVWMKLVKLFHPDKHMDLPEEKRACEEVIKEVNLAKKEGDLEKLEAIAAEPEKYLEKARIKNLSGEAKTEKTKDSSPETYSYDEEAHLKEALDSLKEELREVEREIAELKKSPEMKLWAMHKGRPNDYNLAMGKMERELRSQIGTLEKHIEKMEKKLKERKQEKWVA